MKLELVPDDRKRKNNFDYIYEDEAGVRTGMQVVLRQEYENCVFESVITDHDYDTLGIVITRDDVVDVVLLLRPDEAAALMYTLSGALWSQLVEAVVDPEGGQDD